MSRIDDSNAERRADEARLADARAKERLQKERSGQSTAFDKALAEKASQAGAPRQGFAEKLEPKKNPEDPAGKASNAERSAGQQALGERKAAQPGAGQARTPEKASPQPQARGGQAAAGQSKAAQKEQTPSEKARADRAPDAKTEEFAHATATGGSPKKPGAPVAEAQDEGGGSGGKGQQGQEKDSKSTAFRLPPAALMAPPPLARPKEAGGPRLRGIAQEVVDKIVSRVLVGTNRQGMAEFRIDLKSSALKGLSIKVSGGRGGKIRAVFSGSDREVLEALKSSSQDLVDALGAKGLSLEELLFEDAPPR